MKNKLVQPSPQLYQYKPLGEYISDEYQETIGHDIYLLSLKRLFENLVIINSTDWNEKCCQYENKTFSSKAK